jgi:HK97 gp10 family phage protein
MTIKVRIEGLKELQTALRALPDATAKRVVRRVLKKRAEPIAAHARSLTPVDEGDLKQSIGVSTKLTRRQRRMRRKGARDDIEMFIGAGALPQAHMQEFGTQHNAPRAFLRPAWDAGKDALLQGLKDDLWAEIEKSAARLARKRAKASRG